MRGFHAFTEPVRHGPIYGAQLFQWFIFVRCALGDTVADGQHTHQRFIRADNAVIFAFPFAEGQSHPTGIQPQLLCSQGNFFAVVADFFVQCSILFANEGNIIAHVGEKTIVG